LAWKTFIDRPIIGQGIKSSRYFIYNMLDGRGNVYYHNFVLQVLSTLGIIGMVLFAIIVFKWFKILFKPSEPFVICIALGIVGSLVHQMVDVSFDRFYFGMIFYLIIGLAEVYRHHVKSDPLKMMELKKKNNV
jgi:O-antigen ligase